MVSKKTKNKRKLIIIIVGFVILLIIGFIVYQQFLSDNKSSPSSGIDQSIEIVPLTEEEKSRVVQTVMSSEFIEDVPEKYPIALRFFSFENRKKVWRDGFLIGHNQLLTSGEPEIYLSLHSKYIAELNLDNICEIIKKANENGDLGFHSDSNKASLLWKYKSMLGHRECFGF